MRRIILGTVVVAVLSSGCHGSGRNAAQPSPSASQTITEQQIRDSGTRTAWELLRRYANSLTFMEDRHGRPVRIVMRGRSSITLREEPLVVIDGAEMRDIQTLMHIASSDIAQVRIYSGAEATTAFGMRAASGAIIVETKKSD